MLISDDTSVNSDSVQCDSDYSTDYVSDAGPDLSSIFKLTGLKSAFSQRDKNSELLLALKPHLKEEKQKKVDKAVKILKLIAVWNIAKESGMLEDLY